MTPVREVPVESGPGPDSGLWLRVRKYVEGVLDEPVVRRCGILCEGSAAGHASSLALIYLLEYLDSGTYFSPSGLRVFKIVSAAAILFWIVLAVVARQVAKRSPRSMPVEAAFSYSWAITYTFLLYWTGMYSSPYWAFLVVGGVVGMAMLDQWMVTSSIGVALLGLVAAGVALEKGLIPPAPLFSSFPIDLYGRTAFVWRIAVTGLLAGFIFPAWILTAVMFRRWHEREGEFRDLATKDGLTGLFNRRHFLELFEAEFERARRYSRPLSFAVLDVDYFKRINDQYGHLIGDRVLMTIASVLNSAVRTTDVIARYGGEEFVLLLPETDLEAAEAVAERCRQSVESTQIVVGGHTSFHVTVSLGLVRFPVAGASGDTSPVERVDDLIRLADQALYKAKAAGRNRIILAGSQGEGI